MSNDPIKYEILWESTKHSIKNMLAKAEYDFMKTSLRFCLNLMEDTEKAYAKAEEETK